MKTLIISDIHLGVRNSSQFLADNIESYFFDFLFPYIQKNNITNILVAGDILDGRVKIGFKTLQLFNKIFNRFKELNCQIKVVLGNHDIYLKNDLNISGTKELLNEYSNVEIFDKISVDNNLKHVYVPWVTKNNIEEISSVLKSLKNKSEYLIFGHFELSGFRLVGSHLSESDSIDRKLLNQFKHVYSGHYHISQDRENISYIGSPYWLTWNDYKDKKRIILLNENGNSEEAFTPEEFCLYNTLEYDDKIKIDNLNEIDYYQKKYIKIYVPLEYNKIKLQRFLVQFQDKFDPIKLTIVYNEHKKEIATDFETVKKSDLEVLMYDYCQEFCRLESLEEKQIQFIKEKMTELYNSCLMEI